MPANTKHSMILQWPLVVEMKNITQSEPAANENVIFSLLLFIKHLLTIS